MTSDTLHPQTLPSSNGKPNTFAGEVVGIVKGAPPAESPPEGIYKLTADDLQRIAAEGECPDPENCTGWTTFHLPRDHPAFGRYFRCACRFGEHEQQRLAALFGTGIPPRYQKLTLATFDLLPDDLRAGKAEALALARQFADEAAYRERGGIVHEGELRAGLLLFGPVGRGKTGLAAAICRAWANAGRSPLWATWSDLVSAVQREYGRPGDGAHRRIDEARSAGLLVIDEFGDVAAAGPATDNQRTIAYRIINHRHGNLLPTAVTTNLKPQEIFRQFGEPIYDRLVLDLCHVIHMGGQNLREAYIDVGGPK